MTVIETSTVFGVMPVVAVRIPQDRAVRLVAALVSEGVWVEAMPRLDRVQVAVKPEARRLLEAALAAL